MAQVFGPHGGIRTPDTQFRRLVLYPLSYVRTGGDCTLGQPGARHRRTLLQTMRTEYTHEDGDEVLRRAIAIDALETDTKDVVRRTAAELGVSEAAVERAEREYFKEKAKRGELERFASDQRKSFFSHLGTYLAVNAFLVGLNLMTDGRIDWAIYPLLGWGIGVALHAIGVFNRRAEDFQKQFEEWKRMRKASEEEDDD